MVMSVVAPPVAVIIPSYNRAAYLLETLQSLAAQQYPGLHIFVIDDGSTDETRDTVAAFQTTYPQLIYHYHTNRGCSASCNAGLQLVQAAEIPFAFCAVVNSDDPLLPGWLNGCLAAMAAAPTALVAYPEWHMIDAAGDIIYTQHLPRYSYARMIKTAACLPGPGALYRLANYPFDTIRADKYRYCDDFYQWLLLAAQGPFVRVPKVLACWRRHHQNLSHEGMHNAHPDELLRMFDDALAQTATQPVVQRYAAHGRAANFLKAALLSLKGGRYATRLFQGAFTLKPLWAGWLLCGHVVTTSQRLVSWLWHGAIVRSYPRLK